MSWEDGYWKGPMKDGYPEDYFRDGQFKFPWQKSGSLAQSGRAGDSNPPSRRFESCTTLQDEKLRNK